jgi:phosphoglycolate phosphatase-like HAD superfamily hydrolase
MNYSDIDSKKTVFLFELDDVLYPEKDYLYQVYYLFANLLEYTEHIDAEQTTNLLIDAYLKNGKENVFDYLKDTLNINEKYRRNLNSLLMEAKLPLKLLLYNNMLKLLQDIVIDRKTPFIITNGNPAQQLNKIKQTEWHGLENYLKVYFADESFPKPEPDVINLLINDNDIQRRDIVMIENSETDRLCAEVCGLDCLNIQEFL